MSLRARQSESIEALWRAARSLARSAALRQPRVAGLPPLLFFTDPLRTPDPVRTAEQLPPGAGIVFRHFGRHDALELGQALATVAKRRRLVLLIGADEFLAAAVRADGVHLPQRMAKEAVLLRLRRPNWLITIAAHDARTLAQARRVGAAAAILSPVFPSRSLSAGRPLGPARAAVLIRGAGLPVYALGGVTRLSVHRLKATHAAGVASVDGVSEA